MIRAKMRSRIAFAALALSGVIVSGRSDADPSAAEKATAESLFQQGTDLMSEKRFAPACEKFEGSQQLDPALGTMLRLADCYDRVGRSASAWALFREAASVAKTRGEADRERIAVERAAELEKRLSKLEVRVDRKNAPTGLEIQINGMTIPRATWDAPFPVDPGQKRVSASAPERVAWSTTVDVGAGPDARTIEIPQLLPKPHVDAQEAAGAGAAGPARETPTAPPRTLRNVGYLVGSLGIAGLAVGGVLSFKAYDENQQSLAQCRFEDVSACTPQGKEMRDRAKNFANMATISFVASGAALAGGVVLLLSSKSTETRGPAPRELKASASPSGTGVAVRLEGTW